MTEDETDPGPQEAVGEQVGSVAEEAARLLGVLAGWAGDTSAGVPHRWDEHLATGAPECRLCPVCRTVHVIREAGPDVRDHLAAAAASLLQAAAGLLAAATADPPAGSSGQVQRIDLDDDPGAPDPTGQEGQR